MDQVEIADPRQGGVCHLRPLEVADRLRSSVRTLERWRQCGKGPKFIKVVGRVLYRLEDVEAYEAAQLRASTARP